MTNTNKNHTHDHGITGSVSPSFWDDRHRSSAQFMHLPKPAVLELQQRLAPPVAHDAILDAVRR